MRQRGQTFHLCRLFTPHYDINPQAKTADKQNTDTRVKKENWNTAQHQFETI